MVGDYRYAAGFQHFHHHGCTGAGQTRNDIDGLIQGWERLFLEAGEKICVHRFNRFGLEYQDTFISNEN